MITTKFIFVTGGVLSGLGKGIVVASIGRLLTPQYKVVPVKCDGYLNIDPGTMNPVEHGEVFVLDDGTEVDLDFGHYERFMGITCKGDWNLTSGKILQSLIEQEREGKFLGKTIQVIPHVTGEITRRWQEIAEQEKADIMLIEIGGTVGDLENMWFLEAVREMKMKLPDNHSVLVHLGLIPVIDEQGEQKTKPLQQSTIFLRERGLFPDIFIGRSKQKLTEKTKSKIHWLTGVRPEYIISDPDVESVYELPMIFESEGLLEAVGKKLQLETQKDLTLWKQYVNQLKSANKSISIAICGKYTDLADSYKSIIEALQHSGSHENTKVKIKLLDTSKIEDGAIKVEDVLQGIDGIIIPGGFGKRGCEGKITLIKYVREHKIPFLGICLGFQLAVIEFARNMCGLKDAHSSELSPDTTHPVIDLMKSQRSISKMGGTMRLGTYPAQVSEKSLLAELYSNAAIINERHRHRYEVNPEYIRLLEDAGLLFSGKSKDGTLMEFLELKSHPYFIASQGHNELTSSLLKPNPLFHGLVKAANKEIEKTFVQPNLNSVSQQSSLKEVAV